MPQLHDVKFKDGTTSRVGSVWIKRWPEDIVEVDGKPLTHDAPEPDTGAVESDTAAAALETGDPVGTATADTAAAETEDAADAAPATPAKGRKGGAR